MKTEIIEKENAKYPEKLKRSVKNYRPLYIRGNFSILEKKTVAVVGSRKCTAYGRRVAEEIGRKCAEYGVNLISGLAKGIDEAAMRGAFDAGGDVTAVLGSGNGIYYPASNRQLQNAIEERGLVISEYPDGFEAKRYTFPERNRIISGLADAVVIVEAGSRSGSLITAERAAEQGKYIFAVPGNITSAMSFGTNRLVSDGVSPLVVIDDLFIFLGIDVVGKKDVYKGLGKDEGLILETVAKYGEVTVDDIFRETGLKPSIVNGIITVLEMKGLVFCEIGKICLAKF